MAEFDLDTLIKHKYSDLKLFERNGRQLAQKAMQHNRTYTVYKIAREFQHHKFDITEFEDFICACRDPWQIYLFARDIKTARIEKLQNAIIKCRDLDYIARFACHIPNADVGKLEDVILHSKKNARAAYICLKYGRAQDIQKLKDILIRSKKPRYLYTVAQLSSDADEISRIEDLIIAASSNMYVRLFAANIPGANIYKLESRILQTKNMSEIRKFAAIINSERCLKILLLY